MNGKIIQACRECDRLLIGGRWVTGHPGDAWDTLDVLLSHGLCPRCAEKAFRAAGLQMPAEEADV